MRLIFEENTANKVSEIKEDIRQNESVLIVDKCVGDKLQHRVLIHGDYEPFSPQELKRKYNAPKFEVRSIKYTADTFTVESKSFLNFDEAYAFLISIVEQMNTI